MNQNLRNFSVAALVLGILAIVFMFVPAIPGVVCVIMSIVGIILASRAMKGIPAGQEGHGMAVGGLVLCIITLVLSLIAVICVVGACTTLGLIGGLASVA